MNKLAVITGATSGIGAEFARQLAPTHERLWLLGRRQEKLEQLARQLEKDFKVTASVKILDLSDPGTIENLAQELLAETELYTLVNNAGYAEDGFFHETEWQKQNQLVNVHIEATLRLSHAALQVMPEHDGRCIINVSSVASFIPTPASTLYGATKALIRNFSEALAVENHKRGIRVQALCPGFTITDFHEKLGLNPDKFYKKRGIMRSWTSEYVVRESLKDLAAGRVVSVPGWNYKLLVMVLRRLPIRFHLWLLGRGDISHRYSEN